MLLRPVASPDGGGSLRIREGRCLPEIVGTQDEVYVVIAGYGYLRGADDAITEVTEGDVLFVPKGRPSRFERLSKVFRTWRIRFGSRNFGERRP